MVRVGTSWRMLVTNFPVIGAAPPANATPVECGLFWSDGQRFAPGAARGATASGPAQRGLLDERTLQSTCESSPCTGYDSHKRKLGSKEGAHGD